MTIKIFLDLDDDGWIDKNASPLADKNNYKHAPFNGAIGMTVLDSSLAEYPNEASYINERGEYGIGRWLLQPANSSRSFLLGYHRDNPYIQIGNENLSDLASWRGTPDFIKGVSNPNTAHIIKQNRNSLSDTGHSLDAPYSGTTHIVASEIRFVSGDVIEFDIEARVARTTLLTLGIGITNYTNLLQGVKYRRTITQTGFLAPIYVPSGVAMLRIHRIERGGINYTGLIALSSGDSPIARDANALGTPNPSYFSFYARSATATTIEVASRLALIRPISFTTHNVGTSWTRISVPYTEFPYAVWLTSLSQPVEITGFMSTQNASLPAYHANSPHNDITDYVMGFDYRMGKTDIEFSLPYEGVLNLSLDNQTGSFTPENTSSPYYGKLRPNIRVLVEDEGSVLYAGFLDTLVTDVGINGTRTATITATQAIESRLSTRINLDSIPNTATKPVIESVLRNTGLKRALRFEEPRIGFARIGVTAFVSDLSDVVVPETYLKYPIIGEDWNESTTSKQALEGLLSSEQTQLFVTHDDEFILIDRYNMLSRRTIDYTLDVGTIQQANYQYGSTRANRITVQHSPVELEGSQEVWRTRTPLSIRKGKTLDTRVVLRDESGKSFTLQSPPTIAFTVTTTGGRVLGDVPITVTTLDEGTRLILRIENNHDQTLLVSAVLTGKPLYNGLAGVEYVYDGDATELNGVYEKTFSPTYVAGELGARAYAQYILKRFATQRGEFTSITLRGNTIPPYHINDTLRLVDTWLSHDATYVVIGENVRMFPNDIMASYDVVRVEDSFRVGDTVYNPTNLWDGTTGYHVPVGLKRDSLGTLRRIDSPIGVLDTAFPAVAQRWYIKEWQSFGIPDESPNAPQIISMPVNPSVGKRGVNGYLDFRKDLMTLGAKSKFVAIRLYVSVEKAGITYLIKDGKTGATVAHTATRTGFVSNLLPYNSEVGYGYIECVIDATLTSGLIFIEVTGNAHPMWAGYAHVEDANTVAMLEEYPSAVTQLAEVTVRPIREFQIAKQYVVSLDTFSTSTDLNYLNRTSTTLPLG